MSSGVLIVGGGQAAVSAASRARELDNQIPIILVSREWVFPYQRPPLSKKFLSGEMSLDRLLLKPPEWYQENKIEVMLGTEVLGVDRANASVNLSDGQVKKYDQLLLATGSSARYLPDGIGGNLQGVYHLRESNDSDQIRPQLETGKQLVVVGGGYIGLEVSAVAAQLGMEVTVVEMAPRILQRVAASETSDYYRRLHQSHGVKILEGNGLNKLIDLEGNVVGAELGDGSFVPADMVLVGIGIVPNTKLAHAAGLVVDNGVLVNEFCQTSDPNIYSVGDCASFEFGGTTIRLESVPHAIHQAEIAVENMLGRTTEYKAKPWFWSDQYDVKLQIAGLNAGYDATVLRQGKREGAQSVWYYKDDCLLAVDAMNDAPSFMIARRVLEAGKNIPKHVVGDEMSNLKDWV